jgi:SAM-dependent methyltransferase
MPKIEGKDVKEYLTLLSVNLVVKVKNLREYVKVIYRYYRKLSYAVVDSSLLLMYLFDNPFTVSRRYFSCRSDSEEYIYGETPLTTLEIISKEARIHSQDLVIELGCGRGRTCFWLQKFTGCRVVGLDMVPDFILRAKRIQHKLKITHLEFKQENFLLADLTKASVIYLYGTCLEDQTIKRLIEQLKQLAPGTRIITISYPLTDYTEEPIFEIMKRFSAPFTWGKADVYIQIKK